MDIFDRLGSLIRSVLDGEPSRDQSSADPDFDAALRELEDYINADAVEARGGDAGPWPKGLPESLRRDFRNLEVPPGTPFDAVRKSYKRLLTAFHPDRHSGDPERFRTATEVTRRLNESYARIRDHYEGGRQAPGAAI